MELSHDISEYHATLSTSDRMLCEQLAHDIERVLPEAEGKVWHRHPVWFIEGNPIVGYHRLKNGVRVMFWSGQSFPTLGLTPTGSFQAAEFMPNSLEAMGELPFDAWLAESREIQWNYKLIMKNKGLVKLTDF